MKVSDAHALLGVSDSVTKDQAMTAVDAYVDSFVHMNEPSMATRAFEAFGIIAVEKHWLTQEKADLFVQHMSSSVLSMSADIDQRHAEIDELTERRNALEERRDALGKRYDGLSDEISETSGPLGPILAGIARLFRPSRGK